MVEMRSFDIVLEASCSFAFEVWREISDSFSEIQTIRLLEEDILMLCGRKMRADTLCFITI